jgi:hypothetical protein
MGYLDANPVAPEVAIKVIEEGGKFAELDALCIPLPDSSPPSTEKSVNDNTSTGQKLIPFAASGESADQLA